MAVLSLRKDDVTAVVEVLTASGYESPEDMGKAVLKVAFERLRQRPLYAVAHRWQKGDGTLFFGFEGTENAARKFAEGMGTGGVAQIVTVWPAGAFEERLQQQADDEWHAQPMPCVNCGQHKWQHDPLLGYKGRPLAKQPKQKCKEYIHPPAPEGANHETLVHMED